MKKLFLLAALSLGLQIAVTPFYSFPKMKERPFEEKTFCQWFKEEFSVTQVMTLRIADQGLTSEEVSCVKETLQSIEHLALAEKENEKLALEEFMNQEKIPADVEKMNVMGKLLVADHILMLKKEIDFPRFHIRMSLVEIETSKNMFTQSYEGNLLARFYVALQTWVMEFYPLGIFFVLSWIFIGTINALIQGLCSLVFPWREFKRAKDDLKNEYYYNGIERLTLLAKKYPKHKKGQEAYRILVELKGIERGGSYE